MRSLNIPVPEIHTGFVPHPAVVVTQLRKTHHYSRDNDRTEHGSKEQTNSTETDAYCVVVHNASADF